MLRFVGQLGLPRVAGEHARGARPLGFACSSLIILVIANLVLGLSGCGGRNRATLGERVIPLGQPVPKGGGSYQVGKPYKVADVWYTPREQPDYDQVGSASWYGEMFHGRRTANGEIYDMDRLTAAHPTLPLPVYARVTNLNNGRTIVVRINDRGPYANDRILDLSRRSAELLGFRNHGTATVRVKYLGRAPLNGDDSYERRYLASQSWLHFAAKGKWPDLALSSLAEQDNLPAENPDNLVLPWRAVAPRAKTAPDKPALAGWKATPKIAQPAVPQTTGSIPRGAKLLAPAGGILIQAGSFKSKDNAERARTVLSAIAPVDVTPVAVGGETYFRVRVGPFATADAKVALVKVTAAGYQGATMLGKP
jgi:peptidoglycan lytic transglycosylase